MTDKEIGWLSQEWDREEYVAKLWHRYVTKVRRDGDLDSKASPEQTEAVLERLVPPEDYYRLHMNLIRHGRQICKAPRPLCARCPVEEICPKAGVKSSEAQ